MNKLLSKLFKNLTNERMDQMISFDLGIDLLC